MLILDRAKWVGVWIWHASFIKCGDLASASIKAEIETEHFIYAFLLFVKPNDLFVERRSFSLSWGLAKLIRVFGPSISSSLEIGFEMWFLTQVSSFLWFDNIWTYTKSMKLSSLNLPITISNLTSNIIIIHIKN